MARRRDALAEDAEATKWKNTFSGHEVCWRTDRMAAIEPRRYWVSRVIATWTALSEHTTLLLLLLLSSSPSSSPSSRSLVVDGQSGEL